MQQHKLFPQHPILSTPSNGSIRNTEPEWPKLRGPTIPVISVQGRTIMVGHPHDQLEWQEPVKERGGSDDRLRCIQSGMGATCKVRGWGGPWSLAEKTLHINCLELLAVTLATKTFVKNKIRIKILLRIDNTSAVAYINNLGGTVSQDLVNLAKNLWMWCLERNIHIIAQHLPGVQNTIADAESQTMVDRSDWKLNEDIFKRIDQLFGPIELDLFASRLTRQCQTYFSWWPDPYTAAMDAFLQDWSTVKGFANPPWALIGQVLSQTQTQRTQVILVTPVWKSQPWYPMLLGMTVTHPRLIPQTPHTIISQDLSTMMLPQLAVWSISGVTTEANNFQQRLRHSFSVHGEPKLTNHTTHSSGSGIAGVMNMATIPFLDL